MRQLGRGQSIMLCGPAEVEESIRKANSKSQMIPIDVVDVVAWTISETCRRMKEMVPLWAMQGLGFQHRDAEWHKLFDSTPLACKDASVDTLLETEAQTLVRRYGARSDLLEEEILFNNVKNHDRIRRPAYVSAIRAKCKAFCIASLTSSCLEQEQERELSPEMEQERQVEKPPAMSPLAHSLHADIKNYAQTGMLDTASAAVVPAFTSLKLSTAGAYLEEDAWPEDVLVTKDFMETVRLSKGDVQDHHLRPVNWIMRSVVSTDHPLLIISPYEAQILLPLIRKLKTVSIHVYAARVDLSTQPFDSLGFGATSNALQTTAPASHRRLLNLYAGQLYFAERPEYEAVCTFLGLLTQPPPEGVVVAPDGFIHPSRRSEIEAMTNVDIPFGLSPVPFLKDLVTARKKGRVFKDSHLGRILNGGLLQREDLG